MTSNAIFYEWDHNANAYTRRPANVTGYDTRTTVQPLTGGKLGNVTVRIAQIDVDYGNVVGQPAQPERVISTVAHTLQELNAQKGKN